MKRTVAMLVLLSHFAAACASYTPQLVTLPRIASAATSAEHHGLAIGVNPYLDPEKSTRVFGADLKQAGILPLQVVVHNRSAQPLRIQKKDFILRLPEGPEYAPVRADTVAERLESYASVVGWTIAFGVMGYLLSSSQQQEANAARKGDLRSKEFQDATVAPQASVHGFLFYLIPDGVTQMDQSTLTATASEPAGSGEIGVMLTLPGMAVWRERTVPKTR